MFFLLVNLAIMLAQVLNACETIPAYRTLQCLQHANRGRQGHAQGITGMRHDVSNDLQLHCLLSSLLRLTAKKPSKLHITNTNGFPSQRANNAVFRCHAGYCMDEAGPLGSTIGLPILTSFSNIKIQYVVIINVHFFFFSKILTVDTPQA